MPDFKTEIEILPGWCSEAKFRDIYETVWSEKPFVIVEIGVFGGRSLSAFAFASRRDNQCGIIGIDPYSKESVSEGGDGASNHDWWTQEELDKLFLDTQEMIRLKGWNHFCNLKRKRSDEMASRIAYKIDIIHIDGNHSELCSCRDVQLYLPLVRQGGIIYFDDINWPTTLKAQGMLAEQCDLLRVVDQCAVYRKR